MKGEETIQQFAFNLTEFLETAFSKPFIAGELPGSKAGLKPVVNTCENRESRWVISLSVFFLFLCSLSIRRGFDEK